MSHLVRASGGAALILALLLAGVPRFSGRSETQPPARITSDSVSYCHQLAQRVDDLVHAAARPAPVEVLQLRAEGERLCTQGRLRGGLICLRRAVLLLRGPAQADQAAAQP